MAPEGIPPTALVVLVASAAPLSGLQASRQRCACCVPLLLRDAVVSPRLGQVFQLGGERGDSGSCRGGVVLLVESGEGGRELLAVDRANTASVMNSSTRSARRMILAQPFRSGPLVHT